MLPFNRIHSKQKEVELR